MVQYCELAQLVPRIFFVKSLTEILLSSFAPSIDVAMQCFQDFSVMSHRNATRAATIARIPKPQTIKYNRFSTRTSNQSHLSTCSVTITIFTAEGNEDRKSTEIFGFIGTCLNFVLLQRNELLSRCKWRGQAEESIGSINSETIQITEGKFGIRKSRK